MNTAYPKLESFLKQFKPMLFRRKQEVGRLETSTNTVFYLNQGYVRLYTLSQEGNELTLHIFAPSSLFPLWLENNGDFNGYYFESLTPVEVYSCEKNKLYQFLTKNPAARSEITQQLTSLSLELMKKLETKIFGDARKQVIATILDLAKYFGKKDKRSIVISYWFTHRDIATLAGLSRERVTIEINNLINKKLIIYHNRFITIPNFELLKKEYQ
ncbi:MAG: Crp/Fnr family transcriptional regulator [Candidatus Daviesbacteria bacterium]|nr:Crp/Fnr family transcriptional regulator [Candidatus Daviesbacteria bacterium]